jgi:hypothetical protein
VAKNRWQALSTRLPKLTEAQISALGRCAGALLAAYRDGQALFEVGAGSMAVQFVHDYLKQR